MLRSTFARTTRFIKTNKAWAIGTFIVFVLTSIWIGSYTAAGGAAIAKLVSGLTGARWNLENLSTWIAILMNGIFCYFLLRSRNTYKFVKKVMNYVAVASFVLILCLFVLSSLLMTCQDSSLASGK